MRELTELKNRDDDLIGASVFLTAEEVKEARKEGSIEIEVAGSFSQSSDFQYSSE